MSSVCLSVTLVDCDHIGCKSSKIISPLVSLGCSLLATPTRRVCSKGNTPKFGPKVTHPCWFERRRHSVVNCGRMVTDSATVTMESIYRKLPSFFLMVPSLTPYGLPFPPKWGFHMPPTYANGHISATGDLIHFKFGSRVWFSGMADRTALFTIRTNRRWRPLPCWKNFKWRYLRNLSSDQIHILF